MTDADVERVARAIHHIEYEIDGGYRYDSERFGEGMRDMRRDQARAAIAALPPSARERELEKALQPFAALADRYDTEPNLLPDIVPVRPDTECYDRTYPTLGDARCARAILAKQKAGG